MKKNAKKNNKGFSLVELIIVVAIMAILIGVLGGQYLKFVERSRQSADKTNVDEIIRAVQIYSADPEAESSVADGDKVEITTDGTTLNPTTGGVADALEAAGMSVTNLKLKSDAWGTVTIEFDVTDGQVSATVTCSKAGAPSITD